MPQDMIASILRFLPYADVLTCRLVASSWASEEVARIASDNNAEFDPQRNKWPPLSTYSRLFGGSVNHIRFCGDEERTIPTSSLRSILDACPNVKSVSVDQLFEEDGLQTLFRYTNVEYLAFAEPFTTEVDMINLLRNAPHLVSFTYCCSCWEESLLSSCDVLRAAPNLQRLVIVAKDGAIVDAPHGLRELDVAGCNLTDENLLQISSHLYNIEDVDFSFSLEEVSPEALLSFVRSTPTLKVLRSEDLDDPEGHLDAMGGDEETERWLQSYYDFWNEAQEILGERN